MESALLAEGPACAEAQEYITVVMLLSYRQQAPSKGFKERNNMDVSISS